MRAPCASLAAAALAACAACTPTLESASLAVPGDPTPLAKCRVAASSASPLVTEWPASEKAHLESLASTQAVAVEYAGCELRIVDACSLRGKYTWGKTTLATDTVEISDADDLYAKLPIGAFSLEAELKRSGRLAVRTTVAGQMRLGDAELSDVPREGPCARATHVVSAISVGTFKLLSGGAVSLRGGGGVGEIGSAGGTSRQQDVVREAGDPALCTQATDEQPHRSCSSPIQVFLQPIDRPKTADELRAAEAEKEAQRSGGVEVAFSPPDGDPLAWTLRDETGQRLCGLPCTRWIPPDSGFVLRREEARASGFTEVDVPDSFPGGAGSRAAGRLYPARGSHLAAVIGGVLSLGAGAAGLGLFVTNRRACYDPLTHAGGEDYSGACPSGHVDLGTDYPAPLGPILMGVGAAGLVASVYWFGYSHGEGITLEGLGRQTAAPRVRFGMGTVDGTF